MIYFTLLLNKIFARNKRNTKLLVYIVALIWFLSLLPLFILGFYNALQADDWYFIYPLKHQLDNNNIVLAIIMSIKPLLERLFSYWKTWGGCYTSALGCMLIPGVFSEKLNWLNTVILLFGLEFSIYYFCNKIVNLYMNSKTNLKLIIFSVVSIVTVQLMPSGVEAFYWYNGSFYNIYGFAAALILLIKVFYCVVNENPVSVKDYFAIVFFSFILGGSNYSIILAVLFFMTIELVDVLTNRHLKAEKKKFYSVNLVLCYFFSFINIFAPGNSLRQAEVGVSNGFLETINQALLYGRKSIEEYISVVFICFLVILIPVLYYSLDETKDYVNPLFILIFGYLGYCAMFAPTLYTMGTSGPGRTHNVYWCYFVIWTVLFLTSALGWIKKNVRWNGSKKEKLNYVNNIAIIVSIVVVFLLGNKEALKTMNSYEAVRELIHNEAQVYKAESQQRILLYEDKSIKNVEVKSYSQKPKLLFYSDFDTEENQWIAISLERYYKKNSIEMADINYTEG